MSNPAPARATPHLVLVAAAAVAGLATALAVDDAALAAIAAPFVVAIALLASSPAPQVEHVVVTADRERLVVDGALIVTIAVHGTGLRWVELRVTSSEHLEPRGRETLIVGPETITAIEYRAARWGGGTRVEVDVRGRGPLGLRTVRARGVLARAIRVYPAAPHLRALVAPHHLAGVGGSHPSRVRSEGFEYAESRPFVAGDRVRDINWRMTSRRRDLWVDQRHPDLSGEVVIFLDSFATSPALRHLVLAQAIDAATAIARSHLRIHDRIGLVDLGGTLRWIPVGAGARQAHRVVETLVESEVIETWADKDLTVIPTFAFPPRSLVIALSPLTDPRAQRVLLQLRARHHDVAVIECELPRPPDPVDPVERLGLRLWNLEHETVRSTLRRAGAGLFVWREGDPVEPVIRALVHERRRPHRLHA